MFRPDLSISVESARLEREATVDALHRRLLFARGFLRARGEDIEFDPPAFAKPLAPPNPSLPKFIPG